MPRREGLPDGRVRIHFDQPIMFHEEPRAFLTLRQPTVAEIWKHGDPLSFVHDGRAGVEYVERENMVGWIGRLIEDHAVEFIGPRKEPALALMIEGAVKDFFVKARSMLKASSAP